MIIYKECAANAMHIIVLDCCSESTLVFQPVEGVVVVVDILGTLDLNVLLWHKRSPHMFHYSVTHLTICSVHCHILFMLTKVFPNILTASFVRAFNFEASKPEPTQLAPAHHGRSCRCGHRRRSRCPARQRGRRRHSQYLSFKSSVCIVKTDEHPQSMNIRNSRVQLDISNLFLQMSGLWILPQSKCLPHSAYPKWMVVFAGRVGLGYGL